MPTLKERFNRIADVAETRWSLAAHAWGGATMIASAGIPAWATQTTGLFSQYAPSSWVVAGFIGIILWSAVQWLRAWALRLRINAKYDLRFIEHGGNFDPLETTFERKRIYVNDFVLPSHPYVDNKTFVDCDIIGPANIYFAYGNNITFRAPIVDLICLDPQKKFNSGFIFSNCIFRSCSFQRITGFVSTDTYILWKDTPAMNWIGVPPTDAMVQERQRQLDEAKQKSAEIPKQIEHKSTEI